MHRKDVSEDIFRARKYLMQITLAVVVVVVVVVIVAAVFFPSRKKKTRKNVRK